MSFLDKNNIIAKPGHSRWLVPPAALCVHLCIGQAYAFSVFNLPLTRVLGVTESLPADWELTTLGWIFSLSMVFLGLSAAFCGSWLERVGPRKAMFTAACCFGSGFLLSAIGVWTHLVWLIYLGYGVLGGIGLGIGYISPVKTLITWFPDRPGMATGMAIMGFGGGAMIGAPLAVGLMKYYSSPESVGVAATFVTMGIIYFIFMCIGATIVRIPRKGWKPAGFVEEKQPQKLVTRNHVDVNQAMKTPQFYLLWFVLFLNVTAGIGVLGQASAMSQEMMPGAIEAAAAAGFVGLLSLFNMGGRFAWASVSDYIGRKNTYIIFFVLGMALYALVPGTAAIGSVFLYVLCYCVIISMYGGGFSTIPAYLKDIFGTMHVGAIHGRLLTAWSAAGIMGPVLVNYIRAAQIDAGVDPAQAYTVTMYIMVGLLLIGLICNLCVKAVDAKHHYEDASDRDRGNTETAKPMEG
ncbi:MFS-type transporter involved in bile tolerance, Atg22 family [Modicisalibacter muralis]|uniref:MFS-type transporter involved in bile tolerance, Atg22 family n=1 Tax=Modicisalibacter muralis TaxID=119000 RepID=A0A1G9FQH1_9GAMM|nr:OFA family MFS transporter [Halomonas muralis]SDK90592.1 MFS-type transporter involved in bile tolerance, Atg22 family [Halomonas muralis]